MSLAGATLAGLIALAPVQDGANASYTRYDSFDFECLARTEQTGLASELADVVLDDVVKAPAPLQRRLDEALQICVDQQAIGGNEFEPFFLASFSTMLTLEFKRRITAVGFEFEAIHELTALTNNDPDFDGVAYIDARPELYAEPIARIVQEQGVPDGYVEDQIAGYLNFNRDAEAAKAQLRDD